MTRRSANAFRGKEDRKDGESRVWDGPPIGTRCPRCSGEVTRDRQIRGGFLPVATLRTGGYWDVRMHSCPDCAIGAWRSQVQKIRPYSAAAHAPQGLTFLDLTALHNHLGSAKEPGTLLQAARRVPFGFPGRERILAACELAHSQEENPDAAPVEEPDPQEVMF